MHVQSTYMNLRVLSSDYCDSPQAALILLAVVAAQSSPSPFHIEKPLRAASSLGATATPCSWNRKGRRLVGGVMGLAFRRPDCHQSKGVAWENEDQKIINDEMIDQIDLAIGLKCGTCRTGRRAWCSPVFLSSSQLSKSSGPP